MGGGPGEVFDTLLRLPLWQGLAWVRSVGWEDPQKKGMATHSSILAWRILMNRGAWQIAVHGVKESEMTE